MGMPPAHSPVLPGIGDRGSWSEDWGEHRAAAVVSAVRGAHEEMNRSTVLARWTKKREATTQHEKYIPDRPGPGLESGTWQFLWLPS